MPSQSTFQLPTDNPLPELELEFEPHSVNRIDFIRSMYTWDDPITTQPEDTALLLYLAGTTLY